PFILQLSSRLPLIFCCPSVILLFFYNAASKTYIYSLSLHDALPIYGLIHIQLSLVGYYLYCYYFHTITAQVIKDSLVCIFIRNKIIQLFWICYISGCFFSYFAMIN